jgi:hypothetical protein
MSNEINSTLMDNMRDNVHELWVMDGRPDLEDDCLQYCYDNIDRPVPITMIEFLSKHCYQALSSKDYEHMARENDVTDDIEAVECGKWAHLHITLKDGRIITDRWLYLW